MAHEIAIVMGSTFTSIFMSGYGVVIREPTLAAFSENGKKIIATGGEALRMVGRTPEKTTLIAPVKNGIIVEPKIAARLLKEFITKLYPKSYIFKPRFRAIMGIPTGLSKEDCQMYYDVCYDAGINYVTLVPKIMMAAAGIDLPISSPVSSLIVSLGGGMAEMAVIALSGILSSGAWGITIGGDMMDGAISDYICGKYNLRISKPMSARIKEEVASLYENDITFREVTGFDINTKKPATIKLYAKEIREAILPYYGRISEVIETAINGCGPEISCDISSRGIYLTGGAARIPGLEEFLTQKLDLKINIPAEPELASIIGGGKLLKNRELLEGIIS